MKCKKTHTLTLLNVELGSSIGVVCYDQYGIPNSDIYTGKQCKRIKRAIKIEVPHDEELTIHIRKIGFCPWQTAITLVEDSEILVHVMGDSYIFDSAVTAPTIRQSDIIVE